MSESRGCPFPDCEWSYETDEDGYAATTYADYRAEMHYEKEHAGKVEIQVTLETTERIGGRSLESIREHYLDEAAFAPPWEVANTRTKVLEEADDHSPLQGGDGER